MSTLFVYIVSSGEHFGSSPLHGVYRSEADARERALAVAEERRTVDARPGLLHVDEPSAREREEQEQSGEDGRDVVMFSWDGKWVVVREWRIQ